MRNERVIYYNNDLYLLPTAKTENVAGNINCVHSNTDSTG